MKPLRIRIRIPRTVWPFDPRRFPYGTFVWKKDPGLSAPANSNSLFSEEFVSTEHTQAVGPGIRSYFDAEPYLEKLYVEKKPSITREEI